MDTTIEQPKKKSFFGKVLNVLLHAVVIVGAAGVIHNKAGKIVDIAGKVGEQVLDKEKV